MASGTGTTSWPAPGYAFRVVGIHKAHLNAQGGEDVLELGVGPTVEVAGGNDVVARLSEIDDRIEDRRGAGGDGESRRSTFESGDALFQHIVCRVHQARVDVSKFTQGEEVGGVFGAVEYIGTGAVNRNRAGMRRSDHTRWQPER